jgi:cell filamentation protein, protein adenylyltransferase
MSRYSEDDSYLDPTSGVLKNRFGIRDAAQLEVAEADLAAERSRELSLKPLKGNFDLAHLQAIHHYLFRDLYEWAGQLRTVDISKDGSVFAHHAYLYSSATQIFKKLADERALAGLNAGDFSVRAAYYFAELNALHPFREGNGRTQREFLSHLAHANGYYLAWEGLKQHEMTEASIESFVGETSKLTGLVHGILTRLGENAN